MAASSPRTFTSGAPTRRTASWGVHPTNKGKELRDIKGKHGAPFGEAIMQNAAEGTIKETTYWWPRPGSDQAFEKTTYYTKVGDQVCGVGYYME